MSRLLRVLVACAVGCGCGPAPLNMALAGARTGYLVVTYRYPQRDYQEGYQTQLIVEVDGNSARVSHVCPDSTGSLTATGSGYSASWSGTMACPPVLFSNCSSVVVTYTNATVRFNLPSEPQDTSTFDFYATGTAAGCDLSGNIDVDFFSV
jgi:hypothetical protein